MTHLTLTGFMDPLCECDKGQALDRGESFIPAMYYDVESNRSTICPGCLGVWDDCTSESRKYRHVIVVAP